jgi:hypothetical protein
MKSYILLSLIVIIICSCNQSTVPTDGGGFLMAKFTLADTNGQATTVFHQGQQFQMRFVLINTTSDTLTYYHGFPTLTFHILQGDSSIASSIDGYAVPRIIARSYLAPRGELSGEWRAPNTPAQNPRVILLPGSYQAQVSFPSFDNAQMNPVPPITLTILP